MLNPKNDLSSGPVSRSGSQTPVSPVFFRSDVEESPLRNSGSSNQELYNEKQPNVRLQQSPSPTHQLYLQLTQSAPPTLPSQSQLEQQNALPTLSTQQQNVLSTLPQQNTSLVQVQPLPQLPQQNTSLVQPLPQLVRLSENEIQPNQSQLTQQNNSSAQQKTSVQRNPSPVSENQIQPQTQKSSQISSQQNNSSLQQKSPLSLVQRFQNQVQANQTQNHQSQLSSQQPTTSIQQKQSQLSSQQHTTSAQLKQSQPSSQPIVSAQQKQSQTTSQQPTALTDPNSINQNQIESNQRSFASNSSTSSHSTKSPAFAPNIQGKTAMIRKSSEILIPLSLKSRSSKVFDMSAIRDQLNQIQVQNGTAKNELESNYFAELASFWQKIQERVNYILNMIGQLAGKGEIDFANLRETSNLLAQQISDGVMYFSQSKRGIVMNISKDIPTKCTKFIRIAEQLKEMKSSDTYKKSIDDNSLELRESLFELVSNVEFSKYVAPIESNVANFTQNQQTLNLSNNTKSAGKLQTQTFLLQVDATIDAIKGKDTEKAIQFVEQMVNDTRSLVFNVADAGFKKRLIDLLKIFSLNSLSFRNVSLVQPLSQQTVPLVQPLPQQNTSLVRPLPQPLPQENVSLVQPLSQPTTSTQQLATSVQQKQSSQQSTTSKSLWFSLTWDHF